MASVCAGRQLETTNDDTEILTFVVDTCSDSDKVQAQQWSINVALGSPSKGIVAKFEIKLSTCC